MTLPDFISSFDFAPMCEQYRIWNERINVISRKDIDNVWEHHILHSLGIALYLAAERPSVFERWRSGDVRVLDVGCGGGLPGIPLAAVFPKVSFTLCDSIGKKVRVASEVASALGLDNVRCVHSRVEDLDGQWDFIVSRAVTSLDNFLSFTAGRYKENILYLKGGDLCDELAACRARLGKKMPEVSQWKLSNVFDDGYYSEKLVVNLGNSKI